MNLTVTEAYQLLRPTVTISIDHPHTRALEGRLIAPDGTSVLLFFEAPRTGDDEDFRVTTFDDAATTPVQLGGGHFANASFNPMQPLAQLNSHASQGTWKLVIKNSGPDAGTVQQFVLGLDKPQTGTGLGEAVADQTSIGFRIFQVDPTDPTSKANWTPMGPAGHGLDDTVGRVSSIAVDPSDPSGNTVYAGGASGGVWRTTNFLTYDPLGPTWVPLTDFGPTNAINVGSIAVYPDPNGDPLKTTILVGTGSEALNRIDQGEFRYDGVGLLLSEDAGKTWQVLDSADNFDPVTGVYRAITDASRNHAFVGAVVNKVVFEKNRNVANNRPIAYAAVGRGSAAAGTEGLWRSEDGGRTWRQLFQGEAGDFILSEGSALPNSGFRPTIAYLAIEGTGVLRTVQLNNTDPSFFLMGGGVGRPTMTDITDFPATIVGVNAPADTPNGAKGKIALAAPVQVPGDPLANTYYQSWLYAAVSETNGDLDGLYVTKDAGDNWTRIKLVYPFLSPRLGDNGPNSEPLNNEGNSSLTIAVDPNNPNIVYLGGDRILRIDTTFVNDPYNLSLYNHSNVINDGGDTRQFTLGGVDVKRPRTGANSIIGGGLIGFNPETGLDTRTPTTALLEPRFRGDPRRDWNFLNLARDPYNPFQVDTTLVTLNVLNFNNDGNDVSWTIPAVERSPPRSRGSAH